MVSINAPLARVKRELSHLLPDQVIVESAHRAGHVWRKRVLDPVLTVQLMVLQMLHCNTALSHLRHLGSPAVKPSAMCQARARLPLAVMQDLLRHLCDSAGATGLFHGLRLWLADGSSAAGPDTPALQKLFPQPSTQRPGCGFPLIKLLGLFDAGSGLLSELIPTSLHVHEQSIARQLHPRMGTGDVLLADRGFCSFWHIALLQMRQIHCVFRMHQRQIVNFRPGRRTRRKGETGRPTSRWLARLGHRDQLVQWCKPKNKPAWMNRRLFRSLPKTLNVRELQYRISCPGYRTRCVTVATTLLDPIEYPKDQITLLYGTRWEVETHFRQLKTTMKMRTLKCQSPQGVHKELLAFALAYNLVRLAMNRAAARESVDIERISFIDTLRELVSISDSNEPVEPLLNPLRPGRYEPRTIKRRAKQYDLMNRPRHELRMRLYQKGLKLK